MDYTFGEKLDPTQTWGLTKLRANRKNARVQIINRDTKKAFCPHTHSLTSIEPWLEVNGSYNNFCPLCDQKQRFSRRNFVFTGNENGKEEAMEIENNEEEPPDYLKLCLETHFKITPIPDNVTIAPSKNIGVGDGLFAIHPFETAEDIGIYSGKIIYTEKDMIQSKSDKVMAFDIWNNLLWVDGVNSWTSKINQMWRWPYDELEEKDWKKRGVEEELEFDDDWKEIFANLDVKADGLIYAIQDIDTYQELTIDYGMSFWEKPPAIKPIWDLTMIRKIEKRFEFLDIASKDPYLSELINASTVKSYH